MYKFMNWKRKLLHPGADGGAPTDPPADPKPPEGDTPPADGDAGDNDPPADPKAEAQKMADAIVAKKMKGMPSKEDLAAFKEWKESQKTPEQKESEEVQRLRQEAQEAAAKVMAYERKDSVIGSGVSPTYADFVAFEVGKLVTDDTDFAAALAGYVKANPQFKGQPAPQRTQLPHGGSVDQMDEVEKAFYAINPDLKATGG
ncbi:hypothetical protein LJC60_01075 [Ruminococcaceae bacterium OttesenSCG-928-D13]|nr:hypothetical protein [Ruminococcaceae bacterium OttesenSCG-928-D13]